MFVSTLRGDLPSATVKSTFFTDATGGYPGGVWYFLPPLPDRVASDQGPGQRTVTYVVVAARRPPMDNCTGYAAYVPLRHFTDCQDGAANGAGPSECTAGVTPAPSENLGQDD